MVNRIVVVGGGIAASRSCVELRKAGHDGPITVLCAERHLPYDRPPLSKAALHGPTDTALADDLEGLGAKMVLGCIAAAVDTTGRRVHTDRGDFEYDTLVIATGARPIRLPGDGEQLTLRTVEDADRLRAALVPGARVTVVGSGWIGAEVATAALTHGCVVTCVEAADRPLQTVFGAAVATELVSLWDGILLRTGVGVASVERGRVQLTDGTSLEADVIVSGVGVRPCVDWLDGSGIALDRGVLVDEYLRTSVDGVFAVGDAAVHWSPRRGRYLRALHWDDAAQAPAALAAAVLGLADPGYDPVPYFWSDQFGRKLQYVGGHDHDDVEIWRRAHSGELLGVGWLDAAGELTAYLAVDRPRDALHARMSVAAGIRPDAGRLADPSVPIQATAGQPA